METTIRNATIQSTNLTTEDHGALTAWLYLDYGGTAQGFGGYCLATNPDNRHQSTGFCGAYLWRVLEIAGVTSWEKLPGSSIRVKASHNKVEAIGHFLKDDWFSPAELAKDYDQDKT